MHYDFFCGTWGLSEACSVVDFLAASKGFLIIFGSCYGRRRSVDTLKGGKGHLRR